MNQPSPLPSVLHMVPHLWKSALVSGVLAVVLGVVVLVWPGDSILVAAILFGAYLLISGVAQVVLGFSLHVSAGSRVLMFIGGGAALVLAVLSFRRLGEGDPETIITLLAIWVGIGFIFRGVSTTVSAISDTTLPGRGWTIVVGAISLVAGIVVLGSPISSIVTLTLVIGVTLIVVGVVEIASAYGLRKAFHAPRATASVTPEPDS